MLDCHAVQELVRAKLTTREIAKQLGVSVRTVRRIVREGDVATGDDAAARIARHVGRPQVTDAIRARVQALVLEDPERPPGEICRLLKDDGTPLGLSTVYRVLASVRSTIPASLQVRFEGVAGEYAQFDFGVVSVRLTDGSRRTVHFAAYRLKYSRWMHVVLVPNERVEALIRSLLDSFAASGGVPLRVVFDNPKTVVIRREEGRPVWNAVLAPVAIDYGFTVELCTPQQPQQKGALALRLRSNRVELAPRSRWLQTAYGYKYKTATQAHRSIGDWHATFQTLCSYDRSAPFGILSRTAADRARNRSEQLEGLTSWKLGTSLARRSNRRWTNTRRTIPWFRPDRATGL